MTNTTGDWNQAAVELLHHPRELCSWRNLVYVSETQTGVIDKCSSSSQIGTLRSTYEAFLSKNPQFMEYWISYALWEMKLGNSQRCRAIFDRGLQYGESDLNYWLALLRFEVEFVTSDYTSLLSLFERARLNIGHHFHGYEFYALYLGFLKTYATADNNFETKSSSLIRMWAEIPLYNYAASFEDISNFAFSSIERSRRAAFAFGVGTKNVSVLSKAELFESLKRALNDFYVVTQYKSIQLYEFEKNLQECVVVPSAESPTTAIVEAWTSYLSFAERKFAASYIDQLYKRCLVATSGSGLILVKFSDYLASNNRLMQNREILRKYLPLVSAQERSNIYLKLIDSELYLKNVLAARDLVCSFISVNRAVPIRIYEKLIFLEVMLNKNDESYIIALFNGVISATNSAYFFRQATNLGLNDATLYQLLRSYVSSEGNGRNSLNVSLKHEEYFWACLEGITSSIERVQRN